MIQVYSSGNTDYISNGDMVLFPEKAIINAVLGGTWEASISHPIDREGRWRYLTEDAVVKMPSFNGEQLFRIRKISKSDSGVECTLDPVFYDCRDEVLITSLEMENKTAAQALALLCTGKYSATTNLTGTNSVKFENISLLEALVGEGDDSFIRRWGGEPIYDNYSATFNSTAGSDNGIEIRYGKNIPENGMTVEVDMSSIATRIHPVAYNDYKMSGTGYVDSPLINNYSKVYNRMITYENVKMWEDCTAEDENDPDITMCWTQDELDDALRAQCQKDFNAGIDKPEVTISTDLILLQNTEQYADIANLEAVSLGDTVYCKNEHLGVTSTARVIELTYDAARKRVESVVLGSYQANVFESFQKEFKRIDSVSDRLRSIQNGDGTVKAENVKGFLDGAVTQLKAQYDAATTTDYIAVLFENKDATSQTYGALAIGTQGLMISRQRNQADTDWVWTTAMTAEGLVADTIVAGMITAAITATNFNMTGGSINITTSGRETNRIQLSDSSGYYFEMGNAGWRIVNSNGDTVAWGYISTDGTAGIGAGGATIFDGKIETGPNQYRSNGEYGVDLKNSDIINFNGMFAADEATAPSEGINWPTGSTWDSLWAHNGELYFCPENNLLAASGNKVWNEGNLVPEYGSQTPDSSTSLASGVQADLDDILLYPGIYVLEVVARFNTNASGYRSVWLSESAGGDAVSVSAQQTSSAVTGGQTFVRLIHIVKVTDSYKRYHIVGKQNSGSSLATLCRSVWFRLRY